MSRKETNEVKRMENLFVDMATSRLELEESAIRDMADHKVNPVIKGASNFFDDKTRPTVVGFTFDADEGELIIEFFETIDVSTFSEKNVTLQRGKLSSLDDRHTLTGGTVSVLDHTHVTLKLSESDTNELKRKRIAVTEQFTYIVLTTDAVDDMFGLDLIADSLKVQPGGFVKDKTRPQLRRFGFDANRGQITLSFSETVDASTFLASGLGLQSNRDRAISGSQHFDRFFSGNTTLLSGDGPEQIIEIDNDDLNAIKALAQLATGVNDTFVAVASVTFSDVSQNLLVDEFGEANAKKVEASKFYSDITPPTLMSFDLDMNVKQAITEDGTARLTLRFSETVKRKSLKYQKISISDGSSFAVSFLGDILMDEVTTESGLEDDDVITFRIDVDDSNKLKLLKNISTGKDNYFFGVTADLVTDMSDNAIESPNTDVKVAKFTPDEIAPKVNSFIINLNDGVVTLHFDETVNGSSFDPREFTIMDKVESAGLYYTLNGAKEQFSETFYDNDDGTTVTITLLKVDLDEIKRLELCKKAGEGGTCYIRHTEWLVKDMNENYITACD
jgi:hypothetical protein